jgi:amidase
MEIASKSELWSFGARALAEAIRSGQTSSREVVTAHLDRIQEVNPKLNAVTRVMAESALEAADQADRRLASGAQVGRLHGVPISVKENVDVAGSPTTQGVVALADAFPETDSPQVAALKAAGAIVFARTNLPEFALRWHTDNDLHGATRNPWNQALTPGGSSGGEAVALATGMTPLGLGNDDGGSLRYPPQCTGVAAVKPSLGRVPRTVSDASTESPISHQLLNAEGPMARHVDDLRLALEIMIQPTWQDPWHVPLGLIGEEIAPPMRVALVSLHNVAEQVAEGVRRAAGRLEDAGYLVEEADPPSIDEAAEAWAKMTAWDSLLTWDQVSPMMSSDGRLQMEILFGVIGPVSPAEYRQTYIRRLTIARAWAKFQRRYPLVLGPVSTQPPFPVGADLTPHGVESILRSTELLVAVNLVGLPAVVVPVGIGAGLPQAVQIIGRRYREDLCLDAAAAIEARTARFTPFFTT